MRTATVAIESASPLCMNRNYEMDVTRDREKETAADFEKRTWKNRLHVNPDGTVYMPGTALKNCLAEAAKYLKMQIPGEGKATYTKHFEAGVCVTGNLELGIKSEEVNGLWLFLPADGKRGGGKRVWKCIPEIKAWRSKFEFTVLDDKISEKVFSHTLEGAGKFIGIGAFRPRNNGINGRFAVKSISWA